MLANLRACIHVPIMLLVVIALLSAPWALIHISWRLPRTPLACYYSALLFSGFLGTLVSLECATVLQRNRAYARLLSDGLRPTKGADVWELTCHLNAAALRYTR